MKIAVTGANGFIGGQICKDLLAEGHAVAGLVYQNCSADPGSQIEIIRGSILDKEVVLELVQGADVVIHTAAKISVNGDPDGSVHRTNVEGTRIVANACLKVGVKRLVHISSIHSMQHPSDDSVFDETRPEAVAKFGPYGMSKAAGEKAIQEAVKKGLNAIILNPVAVVGPMDMSPSATGKALLDLYFKKFPVLIEGGYDFVDVRDVAKAVISAMKLGRSGERYIISGEYLSIRRMAALVEKFTGSKQPNIFLPNWIQWVGLPFITAKAKLTGSEPMYTSEVILTTAQGKNISCEKATKELDYNPRPLEESIRDTLHWLIQNLPETLNLKP